MEITIDGDDVFSKDLYYIKEFDPDFDLGERLQKILDRYLGHTNKQGLVFIVKDKVKFVKGMSGIRGAVIIDKDLEYWWYGGLGFTERHLCDPDYDAWDPIFSPYGKPWDGGKYE